jgi:two-component system sensor histidine kinase AdeS
MALLDNALKYANAGPLLVILKVKSDECSLSVEDCGPGLSETFVSSVFNAFEQSHRHPTSNEKGSGLGLAVVKAIAVAHGGQAFCTPSALGGTTFRLCWPL